MRSQLTFNLLGSAVFLAFILSEYSLEQFGIQYTSVGGNPLLKIHIYSYLVMIAFGFSLIDKLFK